MENKNHILIVDDDSNVLDSISLYLKRMNFNVLSAENGQEGYEFFLKHTPSIVITDVKMPKMNGIELLKKIKDSNTNTSVILMTAFSELLETKSAYELGADAFLSKPFELSDLLGQLQKLLATSDKEVILEKDHLDDNFQSIKIEEFISGSKISYPIYIRLSKNKYVRVSYVGEDLSFDRINKYIANGLDRLYLTKQDYEKYISMTIKLTDAIEKNVIKIAQPKRVKFIETANNIVLKDVFSKVIDEESFETAKKMMLSTLNITASNKDLFKLVQSISENSDYLYAHSITVTVFSLLLAKQLEWVSSKNRTNIALGALFHDFGKKIIPEKLYRKKLIELTHDDRRQLEKHPIYGAEMLQGISSIPDDVIQIVLQHHENCSSTGYPNRVDRAHIHPFAKVISIANEFVVTLEQRTDISDDEKRYQMALETLSNMKKSYFDKTFLMKFIEIFKFV